MPRRLSISSGYTERPETRVLPPSYQPQLFPMMTGPMSHKNSFKHNRVAPPSHYSEAFSSRMSPNPRVQTSFRQPPYYPPNNQWSTPPDDKPTQTPSPTSCFSKPLCLGLTRLTGGILFGTMIFLSLLSLGGLITSIVLYIKDMNNDSQWKILGMVVCTIMLLTVSVTLCIFLYCYKKGHILNNQKDATNGSANDYPHHYNYNGSPIPYGRVENVSPTFYDDEVVQVQDKLTNTEATVAPLRPRDAHRGVWPGANAYNGVSRRPIDPPKMTHRVIQALPDEIDQIPSKSRYPILDIAPQTIIRLPEKRSRRLAEPQPHSRAAKEVFQKPRQRGSNESVEFVQLPKKGKSKQRFGKVSVRHVKTIEDPDYPSDDNNTDHFYQ